MNKIGFKKRTVCAVLVSVICILLASSFIFHTVAEASVLTYSLQGASFGNYINDDGTISSNGLDRSLIDNYSVTAQNQYVGITQENFSLTGNVHSAASTYPVPVWDCSSIYAAYPVSQGSNTVKLYTSTGVVEKTYSVTPRIFFSDRFLSSTSVYDLEGNLLGSFSSISSSSIWGVFFRNDKYIVFISASKAYKIVVFDSNFLVLNSVQVYNGTSAAPNSYYCTDKYAVWFSTSKTYIFDLDSFALSSKTNDSGHYLGSMTQMGDRLYRLYANVFYVFDLELNFLFSYTASNLGAIDTNPVFNSFEGSFIIDNTSASYTIASFPNQYYTDFSAQFVDSFTPSKWINFSCRSSTDGTVVGGNAVSIKLDYALSDDYLATVNTYGVKVSGCTMLASLDDLSTGTGYYGLPPLVVKVNGSVVPRITKQYEAVEKVGDVYLYAFSAFCDFQGSTKINSLEIYMNCYVPQQLSRHSFSLPVSDVDLYLDPVGGGESSGGSSGGESSGTPSVDPGESSDDVPGENDPAFLKIYKVSSGGTLSYIRYFPTAQLSKVSVFFGSLPSFEYSRQGIYAISPSSSFLVLEYVDSGQRIIELDFYAQGWSKTPSLSSMHYPLFTGNVIEIDFSNTYSIYLADVVPYGQMRICDYDNTTYSLVNLPAPDSVVNISQYSDTQFQVSCQGSVRYYLGKIARYKEYGFGSSTPWQLYEEGAVLQFSRLGSPLLNTVQLQTYTGEFPPHDPDYEEQIRIEESIRAELESRANEIYGSVSFDPQDESDFDEAKQDVTDVLGSGSVFFNFVNKLWNTNPFTSHFVVITATCAILAFVVRKL